jgi:two-component system, NarL family, nitrate/nitrite response regulator NarL
MPRILIADDHPLFRVGLSYTLKSLGFDVVAEAFDGQDALEKCLSLRPEAALLDVKMPRLDGLSACKQISSEMPSLRIIMLTTFSEPALVEAARAAGAAGFVSKETEASELARLIHKMLAQPSFRHFPVVNLPKLTTRELEVLKHLVTGLQNKEIAKVLGVSPETIKDHLERLYQKLEVQDRMGAVSRARALGLA